MLTKNVFGQLCRFGIVGLSAAAVNYLAVVAIVEYAHWNPLVANIVAYLLAFNVSYLGHRLFTFNHKQHAKKSIIKFFLVVALGFVLNESLFAILLHSTTLHYTESLLITIFSVAIITFTLSKLWAFK